MFLAWLYPTLSVSKEAAQLLAIKDQGQCHPRQKGDSLLESGRMDRIAILGARVDLWEGHKETPEIEIPCLTSARLVPLSTGSVLSRSGAGSGAWRRRRPIASLGIHSQFGPAVYRVSLVPSPVPPFQTGELPLVETAPPVPHLRGGPRGISRRKRTLSALSVTPADLGWISGDEILYPCYQE